jgi:hypothetical protein
LHLNKRGKRRIFAAPETGERIVLTGERDWRSFPIEREPIWLLLKLIMHDILTLYAKYDRVGLMFYIDSSSLGVYISLTQ